MKTSFRSFTVLATVLLMAGVAAPSASAQTMWYDQCGVIDTWWGQAGYGYDQRWHPTVYPVAIIVTRSYIGAPEIYEVCADLVASSNGRYAAHNHGTRPWDYMREVCSLYVSETTRAVSYVPLPVNQASLRAYQRECQTSGGDLL
jgi:hypothetical protein